MVEKDPQHFGLGEKHPVPLRVRKISFWLARILSSQPFFLILLDHPTYPLVMSK